jgi:hypothetical protein
MKAPGPPPTIPIFNFLLSVIACSFQLSIRARVLTILDGSQTCFFQKKRPPGQKHLFRDYKNSGRQSNQFFGQFQGLGPIGVFSLLKLTGFQEKGTISPYTIAI